jgi:hypothetical protein
MTKGNMIKTDAGECESYDSDPVSGGRTADHDVLRHFRSFETPSASFEVSATSDRELIAHGLPPRPNLATHPRFAAKWQRIAALRHQFVRPELQVVRSIRHHMDPDMMARREVIERAITRHLDKVKFRSGIDRIDEINKYHLVLPETSGNWSGAYVKRPAAEPLMSVSGEWRVPGVNPPASAWNGSGYNNGKYYCSVWAGIDGTQGTGDVMQAGTDSVCVVQAGKMVSTTFYAWIEWFALPPIRVSNYPVQVGDLISCTVCAPFGNTRGSALFNNLTSGATTTIPIDPPAGTSLVGNVAEWIVEDPGSPMVPFPNYGSVHFSDCSAGSKNIELDLSSATEIDMVDAANHVISTASIESNRTLFCRHT